MGGSRLRGNEGDIEMGGGRQGRGLSDPVSTTSTNDYSKAEASTELDEKETDYQPVDWKKVLFTPKYAALWVVLIIIGALTALISLKHDQVVDALRPFAEKVRDIPAGWLIFIAVLFVISFPPLFGHELVALLAGVVYGLWIGFGVVAAGTFVGESECSSDVPPFRCGPPATFVFDFTDISRKSERGSPSRKSSEKRQRRWRGRI